jgi:hypothetical protein
MPHAMQSIYRTDASGRCVEPMSTVFSSRRVEVPDGAGTKVLQGSAAFSGDIRNADIAIKSFGFDFIGGPRPLNVIQVATSIFDIAKPFVNFQVECNYLDSGDPDPRSYHGFIDVLIIADVA